MVRTVALHNRTDDVKLSSTLCGSMSDMLRLKQSSSYIARARPLMSKLSSSHDVGSSSGWHGYAAPAISVTPVVFCCPEAQSSEESQLYHLLLINLSNQHGFHASYCFVLHLFVAPKGKYVLFQHFYY